MSARPVVFRVRLTQKQAAIFREIADVVGSTPGDVLAACACADVSGLNDRAEAGTLEVFSAVRTFVRQRKTPLYPGDGITDFTFYTQEDDGQ